MADETLVTNQYLTFTISDEHYALPVTQIREVVSVPKINHIPRMPDSMRGIINLRGSVVPILDLKTKFGMGETAMTTDTAIIVIEINQESEAEDKKPLHIGLFADSVQKVIAVNPDMIEPAPRIGSHIRSSFIAGVGHVDGDFIIILDLIHILSEDEVNSVEYLEDDVSLLADKIQE